MFRNKYSRLALSVAAMLGSTSPALADSVFTPVSDQALTQALFHDRGDEFLKQINYENCETIAGDPCFSIEGTGLDCSTGKYCWGPDEPHKISNLFFCEDSPWDVGGFTQWGYTNRSTGMFNDRPGKFHNHQSWLYLEKQTDGSEGLDFGGRIDFMYGIDAGDTQAFGNNPGKYDFQNGWDHGPYGFALPQLYGEVAYGDLSVKVGHFYTLLGYEVVPATGNFFYSHAFTMYNSEAFTHTGALATYKASDNLTIYSGWTLGWDTGFDQVNGGSSFLGGASLTITDDWTVTYILTAGKLGAIGEGYSHSIVSDWNITDKLEYVVQSDVMSVNTPGGGHNETVGINNYLFYTLTDQVKVGSRAEWWKSNGDSYYGITGGVNVKPSANLTIRPEVRYQWSPAHNAANTGVVPVEEGAIFGIDAVYTF